MLRRLLLTAAVAVGLPGTVAAQSVNISVRAGSLGIGAEAGISLSSRLGVRAGYSVIPIEYDGTYSGLDYKVRPTSPMMNAGIDIFPGFGNLRIGGGVLFASNASEIESYNSGTFEVGEQTFVGDARILGELDHGSPAPYVIVGFGEPTGSGMGLFMDIGAGLFSAPQLHLTASGTATQDPRFDASLERERQAAEEDAREFLRILPIFSIGFKFGF